MLEHRHIGRNRRGAGNDRRLGIGAVVYARELDLLQALGIERVALGGHPLRELTLGADGGNLGVAGAATVDAVDHLAGAGRAILIAHGIEANVLFALVGNDVGEDFPLAPRQSLIGVGEIACVAECLHDLAVIVVDANLNDGANRLGHGGEDATVGFHLAGPESTEKLALGGENLVDEGEEDDGGVHVEESDQIFYKCQCYSINSMKVLTGLQSRSTCHCTFE